MGQTRGMFTAPHWTKEPWFWHDWLIIGQMTLITSYSFLGHHTELGYLHWAFDAIDLKTSLSASHLFQDSRLRALRWRTAGSGSPRKTWKNGGRWKVEAPCEIGEVVWFLFFLEAVLCEQWRCCGSKPSLQSKSKWSQSLSPPQSSLKHYRPPHASTCGTHHLQPPLKSWLLLTECNLQIGGCMGCIVPFTRGLVFGVPWCWSRNKTHKLLEYGTVNWQVLYGVEPLRLELLVDSEKTRHNHVVVAEVESLQLLFLQLQEHFPHRKATTTCRYVHGVQTSIIP